MMTEQEIAALEYRFNARFATKQELKEIEKQAEETEKTAAVIATQLTSLRDSVDAMGNKFDRFMWTILATVLIGVVKLTFGL